MTMQEKQRFESNLKEWFDLLAKKCKKLTESNESYRRFNDDYSLSWNKHDLSGVETIKKQIAEVVPAVIKRYHIDCEYLKEYKSYIEKQLHFSAAKARVEKIQIEETGFYGKYAEAHGKVMAYSYIDNVVADAIKNFS